MPQNKGYYKNIYLHHNYNRNEIREFLIENATYSTRPSTTVGQDKGLLYFDTDIGRIIVWDGNNWKIVKYFDDRDVVSNDNIKLQNIWGESNTVADLTEGEAKGITGSQSVVQYFEDRPTSHIPGSWSYYTNEMEAVIFPKMFVDGAGASYSYFYEPVVKNYLGTTIDTQYYNINEYKVGSKTQYRIEFLDGKRMNLLQVSPSNPPTISFYKYVGERLNLTSISGLVNKFKFDGSEFSVDPNYPDNVRRNLTGTGVTIIGNISSLSVNGQEISASDHYTIYQELSVYYLSIDVSATGTNWVSEGGINSDDFIYLNVIDSI